MHQQTFLHVGCGPERQDNAGPGFRTQQWREIRLDIDPAVHPDIVGSMLDMGGVGDSSVDAVYSSHNIEHLYAHEVPRALAEFMRVLRPDGFAVVTCPDLQEVAKLVARGLLTQPVYQSPAGPISPLDIIYGHGEALARGKAFMAHRCGFTFETLVAALRNAGFVALAGFARPASLDLWVVASKSALDEDQMHSLAQAQLPA